MAEISYGNTVVEVLSTDDLPDKPDGWYCKVVDTGESYIRRNGEWQFINLGLAFIKATKSGDVTTDANGDASVVFETPFAGDAISVALTCAGGSSSKPAIAYDSNVSHAGFDIHTLNTQNGNDLGNVDVHWVATVHYNP
jgi:hypothetical protein